MIICRYCIVVMVIVMAVGLLFSCSKKAPEIPVPEPTATDVEAEAPQAFVLPHVLDLIA